MEDKKLYPDPTLKGDFTSASSRIYRRYGRRQGEDDRKGPMPWLITFTDVMALMLTFFVLLFSMSQPVKEDFSDLMAALNNEFNTFYGRMHNAGPEDSVDLKRIDFDRALDLRYLEALMQSVIAQNEVLRDKVSLTAQGDRLVLSLPQDLLFDAGSAALKEGASRPIFVLSGAFSRMKNVIELVGHTDPRPIERQGGYSSNWDLSLARAAAVAAALERVGYTQPVTIRGASSGRYRDLEGIGDENRRLDLSRRVDIVIMNHDGRKKRVTPDLTTP
jgi:chemotaxis protein MotB